MNIKGLVIAVAVVTSFYAVAAQAGDALTKEELEAALKGNTWSFDIQSNQRIGETLTQNFFYDADGKLYARNSTNETGHGTYSITDDAKVCHTWIEKDHRWSGVKDACYSRNKGDAPGTMTSVDGKWIYKISAGNVARAKP